MDEPFWTNQKFAIVGLALAFLGVAVGIGQWVMPVDKLGGEIKLGLIVLACTLGIVGCALLVQAFLPPATNPRKRFVATIRVCAVLVLIGFIVAKSSETEPQAPPPAPIQKPSEPVPTIHEKFEPIPNIKSAPSIKPSPQLKTEIRTPRTSPSPITVPRTQRKVLPPVITKEEVSATLPETVVEEKIEDILAAKYREGGPGLEEGSEFFLRHWLQMINTVRVRRMKQDLRMVMRVHGAPRIPITPRGQLAAAIFTMRCLEKEGYLQIIETTDRLEGYGGEAINNLEFEFVPERLNEFVKGL